MGRILNGIAHLNELSKTTTNDYYVRTRVIGTLHHDDIIRRLEVKQIATYNVNGSAFVKHYLNECALAVSEGYNVVTDLFHAGVGTHGTILSSELGHNIPANQLDVRMNFTQSSMARAAIADTQVFVEEQPAISGPDIQNVTNPVHNEPNVLNVGAMVLVQGLRIAIRGDKVNQIGVIFTSMDQTSGTRVPAEMISPNTPTRLQFVLPPIIIEGEWWVDVATQTTGNSSVYTKDVRIYRYPFIVQVIE